MHTLERLRLNMQSVFFGRKEVVTHVLVGLVARGHVLIEDVPGVGKTVLARSLARSVNCDFNRIQLTPDMLPSDILGVSVYNHERQTFDFKPEKCRALVLTVRPRLSVPTHVVAPEGGVVPTMSLI